jgi:ATP-binding cassette subfamily B protein
LVLDQGQIVERGTHSGLLEQNGLYAALWNRQHAAEEAEETLRRVEAEDMNRLRFEDMTDDHLRPENVTEF